MSNVSQYTFLLAKCILSLRNAEDYAARLISKPEVSHASKACLKRIGQKSSSALREFTDLLTPASMAVMEAELLPLEVTKQIESVNDMMLALPQKTRDQIEEIIAGYYNVYSLNNNNQ